MENQKTEAKQFVLNYGILLGILTVVMGVIMYVTNAYLEPSIIYSIIIYLILIVVISLGIKAFKTENGGFLSIGEALKVGIGVAVVGGIISALWSFVLMNYLEPDYMAQMTELSRDRLVEVNPNMTESQIEAAMEFNQRFSSPYFIMAVTLIGNLFFGFIISLIAGIIMKKENPYNA